MGRTYKRNDLHNSRRPKSIREKRQYGNRKSSDNYDDFSTEFSTGKYQRKNQEFDNYTQEDY
jgi:hypothetical protein